VVLAAACAPSIVSTPARPELGKPAVTRYDVRCLSGLRIVYYERPSSQVATVTTTIDAGESDDPEGRSGLAHLVEHLTFRAFDLRQVRLGLDLAAEGIRWRAETFPDVVRFHASSPARGLVPMLEAEVARLGGPLDGVDQATFDVERRVVANEGHQRNRTDSPTTGWTLLAREVFPPRDGYGALKHSEDLAAITLREARAWAASHYRPERATIVITGPRPAADVEALVPRIVPAALLGWSPSVTEIGPRARRWAPSRDRSGRSRIVRSTGDVGAPELWVGWAGPPSFDDRSITTNYVVSFLNEKLTAVDFRDDDVTGLSCGADSLRGGSMISCRIPLLRATHPEATARRLFELLARASTADLPSYVSAERSLMPISEAYAHEQSIDEGTRLSDLVHETGDGDDTTWVRRLFAVTADDVTRDARALLSPDRAHAVLVDPAPTPPARAAGGDGRPTRVVLDIPDAEQNVLPEISQTRFLARLETETLANGLLVAVLPRPELRAVEASLAFRAGQSADDLQTASLVGAALKLPLASSVRREGVKLGPWFETERVGVVAYGPPSSVERVVELVADGARHYELEWPHKTFEIDTGPARERRLARPLSQAGRAFSAKLLPGRYAAPKTREELAAIPVDVLRAWLAQTFVPANGMLVVTGDVSPERVKAAARRAFAAWSPSGAALPTPPVLPQPKLDRPGAWPAPIIVAQAGAEQVDIALGCRLRDSDAAGDAMNDVLAAVVQADLETELSRRIGASYEVSARDITLPGGTAYLRVRTAIANDQFPRALSFIRSVWLDPTHGLAERLQTLAYSQIARITRSLFDYESSYELVKRLQWVWSMGWPLESVDRFGSYVSAMRVEDAKRSLHECAQGLVMTLVGDPAVIAAAKVE
jgi:zinc protease